MLKESGKKRSTPIPDKQSGSKRSIIGEDKEQHEKTNTTSQTAHTRIEEIMEEETEYQDDSSDDEPSGSTENWKEKTDKIMELMVVYFRELGIERSDVTDLIAECIRECDRVVGEEAAIEWSKDAKGEPFELSAEICAKDERDLQEVGGDLVKLVSRRQAELAEGRFSTERVHKWVPSDYPEFSILLDIARGVELVVSHNFESSSTPRGPMRQTYLRVAPAVNKVLAKAHDEGLNIMLRSNKVFGNEGVNMIFQHWAPNFPRPEGRAISDSAKSKNMKPEHAVNSLEGKEVMKVRWGTLAFPTIVDLSRMILQQAERVGWIKLRLWKADIRSAYAQLFVAAKDAPLLTAELTGGICTIHIVSSYGFTGTGYAFGPISRVIESIAGGEMKGGLAIYCDDFEGACAEEELEDDKKIAYDFTRNLLGPKAFAGVGERDKYEAGRVIEWIGWKFDLDKRVVSLATKNYKKTLYEFFSVNVDENVSMRTIERLAAFASRYSLIARPMRPFVHHLHAFKNTFRRESKKTERKRLSAEAKLDILMWRTFLIMMGLQQEKYCRRIDSFSPQQVLGILKYDSCLTGLGLRLFRLNSSGALQLVRIASVITPYALRGQSRFQNTMEFSSVSMGFLIMAEMGWRDIPLKIVGDSKASETWCAKERFRSTVARGAALLYMTLGVEFGFWVEETEFIEGKANDICDALSRRSETDSGGGVKSAVALVAELGMDPSLLWQVDKSPYGREMINLCNPLLKLNDDATFIQFAKRMRVLVDTIKSAKI